MINFLIFGPPGSGKGTQSVKLAGKFNLRHLSTGDMLRAEITAGTELGGKMSSIMSKGELVPDEVVIEMIAAKIDSTKELPVSCLMVSQEPSPRQKSSKRC
jgi:adenylate kinase